MSITQNILLQPLVLLLLLVTVGCSNFPEPQVENDEADLVILAHGLAKSGRAMGALTKELRAAGYQTCTLDYRSIGIKKKALIEQAYLQINSCLDQSANTQTVHFVGHSLGGLLIRHYLQEEHAFLQQKRLGRVVMIGTPNHGSAVADHYADKFWMNWLGEIPLALTTSEESFGAMLGDPNYKVGIIAGTQGYNWTNRYFEEPNDGLVSVNSAKLANMHAYIEVNLSHHQLRSDPLVVSLVLSYLKYGVFIKAERL
ncbi:alpha/beta fold hydrolase [Vibrio sp. SCSIO 43153]|uniref:alpha/beta fold hydrolase n=1 Tax=Vibrio sp. SCSIO 43153 TaxID=2819098 RepID=UPI002075CC34|nr:alpha/beta fold hydrolase [Vibrio sp. SCSIO 43153]USD48585.1 alpha/beta fold hydrolase [Vibrio sp. SCSIO 43153]